MHALDAGRVFVTGLSAGGAMASVMLAAYPELFAAGAIIAGLPYGCADNLAEALSAMSAPGNVNGEVLGNAVRGASSHRGPWPRISIWHGSADRLVVPGNGETILRQWRDVHGLPAAPTRREQVDGYPRRVWADRTGKVLIEDYVVTGMAHGTPLMPGEGEGQSGQAGAHMLDARISSTDRIAAFFGLVSATPDAAEPPLAAEPSPSPAQGPGPLAALPLAPVAFESPPAERQAQPPASGVQKVIEDALRAAGLMK
jgi:feruloyl esterase